MEHRKLIMLFKSGKEVLLQHHKYTDAAIFRDIQRILEKDGSKLSVTSLTSFVHIFKSVRDRLKDEEDGKQI